jgi:hypothetical protein
MIERDNGWDPTTNDQTQITRKQVRWQDEVFDLLRRHTTAIDL